MAEPMIEEVSQDPQAKVRLFTHVPDAIHAERVNAAILAAVRAGAAGALAARERRQALRQQTRLVAGFEHFRRLCLGDLRAAWEEDRLRGTRQAKYRRLAWHTLFRHVARRAGIERDLKIVALDHQGNYLCKLVDKTTTEESDWDRFIALGKRLGIGEAQLRALGEANYKRAA